MIREIITDDDERIRIVGVAAQDSDAAIGDFVTQFGLEGMTTLVGDDTWAHFGVTYQPEFRLYVPGEGVQRVGGYEAALDAIS